MRMSLRTRLLVFPTIVVLGAVAIFVSFEHAAQRRELIDHEAGVLLRLTREVARSAVASGAGWSAVADSIDARVGVRVTVISGDGRVLADSRADHTIMENHADRPEVRAALDGRVGTAIRRSATLGEEYLYAAVPIDRRGARVLRLAEPMGLVGRLADSLTRVSAGAVSVAMLVSLLVLAYVSERFVARVRRLRDVARRIGQGDVHARADEQSGDELGRLGAELNGMHAELDARLEALRRERDDRERILAHMSDGVVLLDAEDGIVQVNPRMIELFDVAMRPAPGTRFTAFTRVPELLEMVRVAREEGRTIQRELKPWTTRTRPARVTVTPLAGAGPGPVLIVVHDLSESDALQRLRQDLVANVSHELRTPLTSLRGYAETLLEGGLDDAEHREGFVRVIRDQAVSLQALVEDLLSLAEMERPDSTLRLESFDLRVLAAEQVAAFRDTAQRAGLALELLPGEAVPVIADRVRMAQAIANLVDNALKYTEQGSVRVAVGLQGARAWCEVRDTGSGIPAEDLPRVFERFYRVDKARSRAKGGTGLGLAIVKHALALHDGVVALESHVGQGSTFRFDFTATRLR